MSWKYIFDLINWIMPEPILKLRESKASTRPRLWRLEHSSWSRWIFFKIWSTILLILLNFHKKSFLCIFLINFSMNPCPHFLQLTFWSNSEKINRTVDNPMNFQKFLQNIDFLYFSDKFFYESLSPFFFYWYFDQMAMRINSTINNCTMILNNWFKKFENTWQAWKFWLQTLVFLILATFVIYESSKSARISQLLEETKEQELTTLNERKNDLSRRLERQAALIQELHSTIHNYSKEVGYSLPQLPQRLASPDLSLPNSDNSS